ncbi:MAG: LPS export ABC transporter periplasmic protein LptC [Candidatus Saccharibacteria bacterium]
MNFRTGKNNQLSLWEISRSQWTSNALLISLIGLLLGSCANDFEKIKKFTNIQSLPKVAAQGYEMLSSDSTILRFKLQTPEMVIHDEERVPYTEFPQGVAITQYDSKMNITSFITSRYAKYFTDDDRWEAKNNVIAVNQKGDTLKTEYLVWDRKKGKIYSDQFVQIIQKDQLTSGTSFESNQDFSEYTFKNLTGQMYIEVQNK